MIGNDPAYRAEGPSAEDPIGSRNVWERLIWICHIAFFGSLALAAGISSFDSLQTWNHRGLVLGLTVLLAGWFLFSVGSGRIGQLHLSLRLVHFAVGWSVLGALMALERIYIIGAFALLWHMTIFIPMRWTMTGFGILIGSLTTVYAIQEEGLGAWTLEFLIPVAGVITAVLFVYSIINQSHQRQRLIEELESTRANLKTSERQAGILEERQRLAAEIHDTLAQGFTSIVMHLEAAESALSSDRVSTQHHLDQARDTAREGLGEARSFVRALQPPALVEATLSEALSGLARRWSTDSSINATATITGTPYPLPPQAEVTLFRATQEALANIRKHADASKVAITLSYMEGVTVLDVQDNGKGFDPSQFFEKTNGHAEGSFGLMGMRQRVEQLGGNLLIESAPGEGTTLVVKLPLPEDGT